MAFVMTHLPRVLDNRLQYEAGVSIGEYATLVHLSEADGRQLPLAQLACAVSLSLSRVSRLIDALVAKGDVTKARSDGDGRQVVVSLTDAGLAALEHAYPTQLANIRSAIFDQLTPDDVDTLAALLMKIRQGLDDLTCA
jgi:DNA-binding MarR family transcriptional regulator